MNNGINRNILECKDFVCWRFWCSDWVLIETYWNVKEFDEKNCVDLSMY